MIISFGQFVKKKITRRKIKKKTRRRLKFKLKQEKYQGDSLGYKSSNVRGINKIRCSSFNKLLSLHRQVLLSFRIERIK